MSLGQAADELRRRLSATFLADEKGRRPCHGDDPRYARDPWWKDLLLFHEYFHGETGRGLGASHQTGWTALAIPLLCDRVARAEGEHAAPEAVAGRAEGYFFSAGPAGGASRVKGG